MKRLVCAVLLPLPMAGCGGSEQQGPDASARVACADFRSVMRDVQQGILTDEEPRDKVKELDREASVSTQAVWPAPAERCCGRPPPAPARGSC